MFDFKRTIENKMASWNERDNRLPLVIKGMRRVGKTTVVNKFIRTYHLRNNISLDLRIENDFKFMERDFNDVHSFIKELSIYKKQEVNIKTMIFIDEIQESEKAYSFIKTYNDFNKMNNLPINLIVSGSYIDVITVNKKYKVPMGSYESIVLTPMTFYEFINNIEQCNGYWDSVQSSYAAKEEVPVDIHNNLLKYWTVYLRIGGLPYVFSLYKQAPIFPINDSILSLIDGYLEGIINEQKQDIIRDSSKPNQKKILDIYENIIKGFNNVGENIKKFKYTFIESDTENKRSQYIDSMAILTRGNIISVIDKYVDLKKTKDFKLIYGDMGIVGHMYGIHQYQKLLNVHNEDYGWIVEQFAGIELKSYGLNPIIKNGISNHDGKLKYWYHKDDRKEYEVDYMMFSDDQEFIPIEIKGGKKFTKKSLNLAKSKYNLDKTYIVSPKNINFTDKHDYVPVYAMWLLS
ncbi:MAG: ATP-binding protein [Mycoplasmataceae bacterium]|nr:ATP-binding protein [Mycoplasmataceae bacterium]